MSVMRRWKRSNLVLIGCLAVALSGCTLPDGTLHAVHSCTRADTITVSVDGIAVGTVARGSSSDFALEPGNHTMTARSGNGYNWNPRSVDIESGQRSSVQLMCLF